MLIGGDRDTRRRRRRAEGDAEVLLAAAERAGQAGGVAASRSGRRRIGLVHADDELARGRAVDRQDGRRACRR